MTKCSTSLAIWEVQIKSTMRYRLTPFRRAQINKSGNNKCWGECGGRGTLLHMVGVQTGTATRKTVWSFLKKLKIELSYNPGIALLDIYPKDNKCSDEKEHLHPNVTAAMSTIANYRKSPDVHPQMNG